MPLVQAVLSDLGAWAKSLQAESGTAGVYVFGSLIYRDGAQFGAKTDIDLVVNIPAEANNARKRAQWLDRLREQKQLLEVGLAKTLGRTNVDQSICSTVAVTPLEVAADIQKDGTKGFFRENLFHDLVAGKTADGLPHAGSRAIDERLSIECVRFAQKKRNAFLAVSANGRMTLGDYDGDEPRSAA